MKKFVFLISFIIFSSNLVILKNINSYCQNFKNPIDENYAYNNRFGCRIHDSKPFQLSNGYNFLKNYNNFSFEELYVPGVYYSILPSIINGMKVGEYKKHYEINGYQNMLNAKNKIDWHSADANLINSDKRIKYVYLGNMSNSKKVSNDLSNLGWNVIFFEKEKFFLTETRILIRPD